MEKKKNLLSRLGEIGSCTFLIIGYFAFSAIENKVYQLKKKHWDKKGIKYIEWKDTEGFNCIRREDKIYNY